MYYDSYFSSSLPSCFLLLLGASFFLPNPIYLSFLNNVRYIPQKTKRPKNTFCEGRKNASCDFWLSLSGHVINPGQSKASDDLRRRRKKKQETHKKTKNENVIGTTRRHNTTTAKSWRRLKAVVEDLQSSSKIPPHTHHNNNTTTSHQPRPHTFYE